MKELSYDKMIEENKRDISHFENQIEYCMDQMRKRAYDSDKDSLDELFKRAMHFMISLWTSETYLIDSQVRHKITLERAKTQSGAIYGKAVLEGGKDADTERCENDDQ